MLTRLGAGQRNLIGLGGAGGKQRRAIVELHLFYCSVRVIGSSGNGDIGKCRRTGRSKTDIFHTSSRRSNLDVGRGFVQRETLAEVPYLLACINLFLLANPMAFVGQLQQPDLDTVVTRAPGMHLGSTEAVVVIRDFCRCGTAVVLDPHVKRRLGTTEGASLVSRTMDMQDRYGTHVSIGRSATHGIAADRAEGRNKVGNSVHGVVRQHATHAEAAEIDAVTVNLVLRHHLVNNGLDEIDVAVAAGVPRLVDAIGKYTHELSRIAHGLHAHVVVLELAILHPAGILIVAVAENEQRAVLA